MGEFDMEKAAARWEKAFEKEMSYEEKVMFGWGYAYAINDDVKLESSEVKKC